jgi:hypothetical protein
VGKLTVKLWAGPPASSTVTSIVATGLGPQAREREADMTKMLFLKPRPDREPLSVRLTVDSHVYLYGAELMQDCGGHSKVVAVSTKGLDSAAWSAVSRCSADATNISFGVRYETVYTEKPGHRYTIELAVLDSQGVPLDAYDGSQNPCRDDGEIGPAGNPTDMGRFGVFVG